MVTLYNAKSSGFLLSSVQVGVDDAGQEEHSERDERGRGHDGEVVRVGHLQPPHHGQDAAQQRVADVRLRRWVQLSSLVKCKLDSIRI